MTDDHTASRNVDVLAREAPHLLHHDVEGVVDRDDLPSDEAAPLRIVELAEGCLAKIAGWTNGRELGVDDDLLEIRRLARWLFADAAKTAAAETITTAREGTLVALYHDVDEFCGELARAADQDEILQPVRVTKHADRTGSLGVRIGVVAGFLTAADVLVRLHHHVGTVGIALGDLDEARDEATRDRADQAIADVERACAALDLETAAGVYLWAGERPWTS